MTPLYIFDLDGTLALTDHRQHLVRGVDTNWREFFAACVHDTPNLPVIKTMLALRDAGAECWIWSGRSDEVQEQTENWLMAHRCLSKGFDEYRHLLSPNTFRMRKEGDHTPDEQLKRGWLSNLEPEDRVRLVAVFDDRDKVVAMWREAGVPCFQVARGEF